MKSLAKMGKFTKEEIDLLDTIGDVAADEFEGVNPEAFSREEYAIVSSLVKRGYVKKTLGLFVLTNKSKKLL